MRKTKIVCTIGPACDSEETLEQMCLAGVNDLHPRDIHLVGGLCVIS